jgi:hypothetical protein
VDKSDWVYRKGLHLVWLGKELSKNEYVDLGCKFLTENCNLKGWEDPKQFYNNSQ